MRFDYDHQDVLNTILQNFKCEDVSYNNEDVRLKVEISESEIEKYEEFIYEKL